MTSPQPLSATPPHLLHPESHQPGSAHQSPSFNQHQFSSPPGGHIRHASLRPEASLLPQMGDWSQPQFQGHRRRPSEYSDVSSCAPSPNLASSDTFEGDIGAHSPHQRLYDPVMGMGSFDISDKDSGHQGRSPYHSPAISPSIVLQQMPDQSAGFGHLAPLNNTYGAPATYQEIPGSVEAFPTPQASAYDIGQLAPPAINISGPKPSLDQDSSTLSDQGRPRSRPRAISDPFHPGSGLLNRPANVGGLSPSLGADMRSDGSRSLDKQATASYSRRLSISAVPNNGVALRLANPEYQNSENSGPAKRVQKHPATFQCTLCPKRFTRAYNLRFHLRTHADERPFVCTVCAKAFARQDDRNRHESLHSFEKNFVCKGDLKVGGQWGCGRRFARADALARHFRSEAGRVCIKPLLDEEISERSGRAIAQERLADPEPSLLQNGSFTLPASLVAQYPALARIDWQAGVPACIDDDLGGRSTSPDYSDYASGDDSGHVSDDATGFGRPSWNTPLHVASRSSRTLDDRTAEEFSTRFARCLASRSGAHTWGKSVLVRLGHEGFISQLNTVLIAYSANLSKMGRLGSYLPVIEAINQTSGDICFRFCALAEQNEADCMEFTRTSSSVDEGHYLGQLQSFMNITDEPISSGSFESLSLLVRENLYSTPIRSMNHVEEALGVANAHRLGAKDSPDDTPASFLSGSSEFVIETNLSLLDYIKHNFPGQRVKLSTLVTITGTAFYAYATRCLDYLKRTWPDTGEMLLPILQEAIEEVLDRPDSTARVFKEHDQSQAISAELSRDGTLKLRAKGPEAFVVDLIQQLCWLTATFSTSPPSEGAITYCMPIIKPIRGSAPAEPIFRLDTSFTKLVADEKNSCWLSLFSNAVIAYGFPIPERENGMGLEMSVDLMAAIVGARHAVTFDGGVVIKGFSSMFVPVMRTRDGIQWHYVANSDPEVQLSDDEGVKQCSNRALLPDVHFASLATVRCFIGWNSLVEIRLGDGATDFDNIEFSDATEVKATLQIPSASVGFQQFGLAQIDVTFGKRDGKCHFQRSSSYRRIVAAAERMFIALFDTGERRGYLVAASGLLLHILHHRVSSGLGGVPASKVNIASAESFTETLLKNAKLRLSSEGDEPLFLDDVVSEIWSILELLQAQSISAEKNSKLEIHATWQERLLGYEYKAVVEDWSPMPLKELEILKTCGGWPRLVRDVNALVLLANGFGDLIRPINQSSLCHEWKTLPQNMDYIAVPGKVLLGLYSLAGCRQTKKRLTATNLQLHGGGASLFQPCPTPKDRQCLCDRLHQVVSSSSFGQICVTELIEGDGAVVIGKSGSLLKRFMKRSTPKITGIRSHTNAAFDSETSANWNSDASRSSSGQSPATSVMAIQTLLSAQSMVVEASQISSTV
ncbi:hypothetical protein BKA56DRAFT_368051 [Ilyonectria sp. MPI-CAGE-AT-0026]|nr:hypothetical protein BKA56DRAFT_368051 [Ilyonectria sp. MPI-CAGE-AT-0026]